MRGPIEILNIFPIPTQGFYVLIKRYLPASPGCDDDVVLVERERVIGKRNLGGKADPIF